MRQMISSSLQNSKICRRTAVAYPSWMCVNRTIASNRSVFIEVLRNWKAHENWEPKDELGPKAVEVTELKETNPSRTCWQITNTVDHKYTHIWCINRYSLKSNNTRLKISTHQHKQRKYNTGLQRWVQVLMRIQLQICLGSQYNPWLVQQHNHLCS